MNIKLIIRENLIQQSQINEKFEKLSKVDDGDEKFFLTMDYLNELANSGYNEDDLKTTLEEQLDFLTNAFGFGTASSQDAAAHKDFLGKSADVGMGGAMGMAKEWLVQKTLNFLGFEGPLANALSTALTRMSLMDLVSVYNSHEGCMKHSRAVARALSEALVRYIVETATKQDSFGANFIRNMLFEYFQTKGYDRKLGQFVCRVIHKNRDEIVSGARQKFGGRENFNKPKVNRVQ